MTRLAGRPAASWEAASAVRHGSRVPPGAGDGRQRVGPGGLWLLLVPVACCGGPPLLVAVLAAAGALAWGGLGMALARC